MTREPYPSDHRRWFRVMEDILDDPEYRSLPATTKVVWIDLLAYFNRARAHRTGNAIVVARRDWMHLMAARTLRDARTRASRLQRAVNVAFARVPEGVLILIPKWAKLQGLTPTGLPRSSAATPPTTPTPTPTVKTLSTRESRTPSRKNRKAPPTERAHAVWSRLVDVAARYGKRWEPKPSKVIVSSLSARIRDGASDEDLENAILGYVEKNGLEVKRDGWDPMDNLTAYTIYRPTKFPMYLEAYRGRRGSRTEADEYIERYGGAGKPPDEENET